MTVPAPGGPWAALLTIAILTTLSLGLTPHAVGAVIRRRRAARQEPTP